MNAHTAFGDPRIEFTIMQVLSKRIPAAAAVALSMTLAAPLRGDFEVIEAYTVSDDGMTRDSLSDANLTPPKPTRSANRSTAHRRRARTDPKDFVASSHARHHHGGRYHGGSRVAGSTRPPMTRHRGPVVGFVYWWNGWVIRTFHTKFGTVLLGTVGAKS